MIAKRKICLVDGTSQPPNLVPAFLEETVVLVGSPRSQQALQL